ncbi:DoxX-like family protein [Maribacter sp. MAR_2009_72]|uniref:DoxX-like family protein n=1 Tax=Maribacter sp. MAR_2009_72 TaxID=1250050 RepID=UPI001199C471|nr:DoxX-like family protein [Maribacter sp. MAR_2009_72]TVZ15338.1 DoxX-like protein [Maribacter sp. MAR_2009_72]
MKTIKNKLHLILNYLIAIVWLLNGLICKIFNLVPRHQEIVGRILGENFSRPITVLIGISEIIMAVWIVSKYNSRINALLQISIVLLMNFLEYFLVPDLLLWGKMNSVFALLFVGVVYYNEFILKKQL